MQEYKRLKPSSKRLFTDRIYKEKMEFFEQQSIDLQDYYSTDSSLEGKSEYKFGKQYKWIKASCGLHMKLSRIKSQQCKLCHHQSHLRGFEKVGVEVVGKLEHSSYLIKLSCGHVKKSPPVGINYNEYCFNCKIDKIVSRFPVGSAILWFQDKGLNVKVLLPCGHAVTRKTNEKSSVSCPDCSKEDRQKVLDSVNAIVNADGSYLLSCGHSTGRINWKNLPDYKCPSCAKKQIADRGIQYGLQPTYEYDSETKAHGFILPCGHKRFIRANSIHYVPECKVCGDGHYNRPSDMYLVVCNTEDGIILKFGVANNTFDRIKEFTGGNNIGALVLASVGFKTKFDAIRVEKQLHAKYKGFRLDSNFVKKYLVCGFTECYPPEMMDTLSAEFSKLQEIYAYSNRYGLVSEYKKDKCQIK